MKWVVVLCVDERMINVHYYYSALISVLLVRFDPTFFCFQAEVEKLNKELHELLRRRNEERRRRRERRKRKKEKAAAAERYRQQAEEREAAHEAGITTHSIGLEEENGATAATQGNGRHTSTVRNRQRNKKSNTLDTQKKLQEFMRKSPYAHPPIGKPPV